MSRNKNAHEHYLRKFLEKPEFISFPNLKANYKDLYYSKDEVESIERHNIQLLLNLIEEIQGYESEKRNLLRLYDLADLTEKIDAINYRLKANFEFLKAKKDRIGDR